MGNTNLRDQILLSLAVGRLFLSTAPIIAGEPLSDQEVVRQVLANNSMLKASAAKWAAAKERVPQAKAWEDPMVGVDFERTGTTRLGTYSDAEWMASQTLPFTGKNLSRGRAAEAEARAVYEELRRARLDVTATAKAAYYRLANAYAQLGINRQNSELLKAGLELSEGKLSVGKATQADVLSTNADIQKLELEFVGLEQALFDQQTAINVLMNRPAGSPLGKPDALTFRAMPWTPAVLEETLLAKRPEISSSCRSRSPIASSR